MSLRKSQATKVQVAASGAVTLHEAARLESGSAKGRTDSRAFRVAGTRNDLQARPVSLPTVLAPNAFSRPAQSIASTFNQQRVSRSVERNPRYHGYVIESGWQAQASHDKTQRILKGALR